MPELCDRLKEECEPEDPSVWTDYEIMPEEEIRHANTISHSILSNISRLRRVLPISWLIVS